MVLLFGWHITAVIVVGVAAKVEVVILELVAFGFGFVGRVIKRILICIVVGFMGFITYPFPPFVIILDTMIHKALKV